MTPVSTQCVSPVLVLWPGAPTCYLRRVWKTIPYSPQLQRNVSRYVASQDPNVADTQAISEKSSKSSSTIPLSDLVQGQIYEGTVKGVAAYGCFVDIGSETDGLVHLSQLSHGFVKEVSEFVSIGQKVQCVMLEAKDGKISLSMKQAQPVTRAEPEEQTKQGGNTNRVPRRQQAAKVSHSLSVGDEVTGIVMKIVSFGAFIKLSDGFEVLLPVSEMAGSTESLDPSPFNLVKEQAEITATVVSVKQNKVAVSNMTSEERGQLTGGSGSGTTTSAEVEGLGGSLFEDIEGLGGASGLEALLSSLPTKSAIVSEVVEAPEMEPEASEEVGDVEEGTGAADDAPVAEQTDAPPAPDASKAGETVVTLEMVKQLRQDTGSGIKDCKDALVESNGDIAAAKESLRMKGLASVQKKSGRIAAEGVVAAYIHSGARLGTMVEVNCETDFVARGEKFKAFAENLAMQAAACPDAQVLTMDDVPEDFIAKEREIEMAKEDILEKPEAVRPTIVEGRLNKLKKSMALMEQPYILAENNETVDDVFKDLAIELRENISVRRFVRYDLGEGLEKKSDDFAAEVAAQTSKEESVPVPEAAKEEEPKKEEKPEKEEIPDVKVDFSLVKELRETSKAGIMDCKTALQMCNNDLDAAADWLKKKGLASAMKKSGRIAAEGVIEKYVHTGSNLGVLVEVNCETDFVAKGEMFRELASDIAMQVAACPEVQYVSSDDVPEDVKEAETRIASQSEEVLAKDEKIRPKIVEGKVNKIIQGMCLLDQPFIKQTDKTVDTVIKETIAVTGENMKIRRFTRFNLGEGLEKKKDDFAAEVAAQTGQA